jgi:lysophospholipase L1-like esterase
MKRLVGSLIVLLLALAASPVMAAESADEFFFKKGDRIVFLGDSITEQYQYSTYIELYLTTRFPKGEMTFLNAGIGGDTATGGAGRFTSNVLDEKPTAVTINFGMNDGGYGGFNATSNANFVKKTRAMLEAAKKAGVRVALCSPNAVQTQGHPRLDQYLETQKKFYAPLKGLAEEFKIPFADQYTVTRDVLEKIKADKAKVSPFPDGVHTGAAGGLLMAHTILTALHAPALVSQVEIDVGSAQATCKAARVEKLESSSERVSFDRTDDALPLPVGTDWTAILPYVNQLKDLNWYGLKITGLNADQKYTLSLDGKEVGTYSGGALAEGVNLGNLQTGALYEQGQKLFRAVQAKNDKVHRRFRDVVLFQAPDWLADVTAERKPKELAKRMQKIDELQAEVYQLAQSATHHFELKAAK